jgi:hypothetical protein
MLQPHNHLNQRELDFFIGFIPIHPTIIPHTPTAMRATSVHAISPEERSDHASPPASNFLLLSIL